ncbi:MAG: hypothetical protein ABW167_19580 [Baekduia sp.]
MSGYDHIRWALGQDCPSGEKNALAAIALACDQQGVTFAAQPYLAAMLKTSERSMRGHMAKLAARGLITRYHRQRANGSRQSDLTVLNCPRETLDLSMYSGIIVGRVEGDDLPTGAPGNPTGKGLPVAEPTTGKSVQSNRQEFAALDLPPTSATSGESARERASERAGDLVPRQSTVKVGGKPVNAEAWSLTERCLASFNEQAGKKLRLLKSSGEPSEAAKRIYGRVRAYPDITLAEHADIIRRTLASQWWGKGEASIGVVYGPNVFEDNITRRPSDTSGPSGGGKSSASDLLKKLRGDG